ncbi:hypothetical protein [Rugamonas sp. DEMB1]|uniref:hypothetical protein n=1 Tax=Rugamonas sp. DEMB1 TaxID=3039386 RepID=UPI00244AE14E|nr:hypothetical protein [Rugamonas sp. DEMB1]WGG48131.1 hypothetical protein QC826_15410 [Rugamonas sp. DEMB1]
MKIVLLLTSMLLSQSLYAQEAPKTSTFHRLLLLNEKNELMVVKIKNSNRWVTPGWYQDDRLTIAQGLDELAAGYGVKIATPTLRGVFTLKGSQVSTRLIYTTKIKSGELKNPELIEEIKWLPIQKAVETITFPHISAQITQLSKYPDVIWGGAQTMYQENGVYGSKVVEDFYPLSGVLK